jgi:hypothetical protein
LVARFNGRFLFKDLKGICSRIDNLHITTLLKTNLIKIFAKQIEKVLLWFSGKDLLAAMNAWCLDNCFQSAGHFRAERGKWCRNHPNDVVAILPEWQALRDFFKVSLMQS